MRPILVLILLCFIAIPWEAHAFRKRTIETLSVDFSGDIAWTKMFASESAAVTELFRSLSESSLGKSLLKKATAKAAQKGKTLFDVIRPSDVSFTDTVLTRTFSAKTPEGVAYESDFTVHINSELPLAEAVLDLAHELTHYIYRTGFDPYSESFTPSYFVSSVIEDKGGEADAYLNECLVKEDLKMAPGRDRHYCGEIRDARSGKISKAKTIEAFYKIGPHKNVFLKFLKETGLTLREFPSVSSEQALFFSSVYDLPYPIAALMEYKTIMERVCENDKKRLDIFREKFRDNPTDRTEKNFSEFEESFNRRCPRLK
jgi:hypothetical protein